MSERVCSCGKVTMTFGYSVNDNWGIHMTQRCIPKFEPGIELIDPRQQLQEERLRILTEKFMEFKCSTEQMLLSIAHSLERIERRLKP